MHHYLHDHGRMSEDTRRALFTDLKPQNVLLDAQIKAKLSDFGLGASFNVHQLSMFCGSPAYVAPELFLGEIYDGRAANIWSLGVLLYKMLMNTIPFEAMNWEELLKKLGSGQYAVPP